MKKLLDHDRVNSTKRIDILATIANEYRNINNDTGINYANMAIKEATIINYNTGLANSYRSKGNNMYYQNLIDSAMEMYKLSLQFAQRANDIGLTSLAHKAFANVYMNTGKYKEAFEILNQELRIGNDFNNDTILKNTYNTLGILFQRIGSVENAINYQLKGIDLSERIGTTDEIAQSYHNISSSYFLLKKYRESLKYCDKVQTKLHGSNNKMLIGYANMQKAENYSGLKKFDSAFYFIEKAEKIINPLKISLAIGVLLHTKGTIFLESHQYKKSINCASNALPYFKESGDLYNLAQNYTQISTSNFRLFELSNKKEKRYLLAAIKNAKLAKEAAESSQSLEPLRQAYGNMAVYYSQINNYKEAYDALNKSYDLNDTLYNDELKSNILKHEFEFEQEKLKSISDQKVQKEKNIKKQILIIGVSLLVLSALSFFFYRRNQKIRTQKLIAENEKEIAETEMKALRAQMNPHFIFNSLNSISNYISHNENKVADEYLAKFAKLMRAILENSEKKEILLSEDLKALELYLQLEALRSDNKFSYEFNIASEIDIENVYVPPLILQPFVENSVWHGFSDEEIKDGRIKIEFSKKANNLLMAVEDNGIGRFKNKGNSTHKQSLGMKITNARLNLMNKEKNVNSGLLVLDLKQGTRVEITIPYITD